MRPSARLPRTTLRPAARGRSVWPALLGLLLLLGALDFHPMGESHALLDPLGDAEYSSQAVHPEQPLHIEPGEGTHRPHCPVCLQRHQLGGLHLQTASGLALPAARPLAGTRSSALTVRGSHRPFGARAPPAA